MDRWTRVRIVFGKTGRLRFLGQLDLGRTLERAIRRSGLPARHTEGFNPRLRMSFPCASPTGMASRCEILEIQVAPPEGAAGAADALRRGLPPDLPVLAAEDVPEGERLRLLSAAYGIRPKPGAAGAVPDAAALEALLARAEIPVERRGRTVDLRPLLGDLRRSGDALEVGIRFLPSGATARPEDLLAALGADPAGFALERTGMTVLLARAGRSEERSYGA